MSLIFLFIKLFMLCLLSVSISGSVELLYLLMNLINFIYLLRSSSLIIKLLT
jgi:hypothetical protein